MSILNKTSTFVSKAADNVNNYTEQARQATERGIISTNGRKDYGSEGVNQAADWIKNAADSAMAILDKAREPLQKLPPILLLCRLKYLPGLSATALTATIVQELADRGFITELNMDGTPNDIVQFVQCIVGPLVQHIKDCAAVQGVVTTPTGPMIVSGKVD